MSIPLDLEQSQRALMNPQVQETIEMNANRVGVSAEQAKIYGRQPKDFIYLDRGSRGIFSRALRNMKLRPDVTTVLWVKGENGGVGKTATASQILAEVMFNPRLIDKFIAQTGYRPEAVYTGMTGVGIDLQKVKGQDGLPLVKNHAPYWEPRDRANIRTRLVDTVKIATPRIQMMNKERDSNAKVTTLLVVEDLTRFEEREMYTANPDEFAIYRLTNPDVQGNAGRQREFNDSDTVLIKDLYATNGGIVLDRDDLRGTDALDLMGKDESRVRAFNGMNEILVKARPELALPGAMGETYTAEDLTNYPDLRNMVLDEFYKLRIREVGFKNGQAVIVPNTLRPEGMYYNLYLIKSLRLDSNRMRDWLPSVPAG